GARERHVETDVAGEPRAHVDGAREHRRMLRDEQDVVEGQRGGEADRDLVGIEYVGPSLHSVTCKKGRQPAALSHAPWHFLYFFPLPQGQGSFRPAFGASRLTWRTTSSPPVRPGFCGSATAGDETAAASAHAID